MHESSKIDDKKENDEMKKVKEREKIRSVRSCCVFKIVVLEK